MKNTSIGSTWTEHRLATGSLYLKYASGRSTNLFHVAERINPKRAFLFVSTVLGRHIPVDPKSHRTALKNLAHKVGEHLLDGPVIVMGYAETAVGLGAGVFEELRRAHPGRKMCYQATTRFEPSANDVWFRIEEPHSHASNHTILKPKDGVLQDRPSTTLVLVDDETTTGTTFHNLASGLHAAGARFERVILVTLTDWSEGSAVQGLSGAIPGVGVIAVSLFEGAWRWKQYSSQEKIQMPGGMDPECPLWCPSGDALLEVPRFGIADTDANAMTYQLASRIATESGIDALPKDARILVLGTGEHVWGPFLFAEYVAKSRPGTRFLSTTRSPILVGETIRSKITFGDHYGRGLSMYLHNASPYDWDAIVLFNETGIEGVSLKLIEALGVLSVVDQDARVVRMGTSKKKDEA